MKMGVRRLCDLANPSHADHRAGYRDFLARGGIDRISVSGETSAEQSKALDQQEGPQPTGVFAPISRLNQHLEILEIIDECDYRSPVDKGWQTSCGCNPTWICAQRCGHFRDKEHEVSKSDCIACVTSR